MSIGEVWKIFSDERWSRWKITNELANAIELESLDPPHRVISTTLERMQDDSVYRKPDSKPPDSEPWRPLKR